MGKKVENRPRGAIYTRGHTAAVRQQRMVERCQRRCLTCIHREESGCQMIIEVSQGLRGEQMVDQLGE